MAEKFDILAIGAHAGDMEIACGPVIAKHSRLGKKTLFLHMTPGEKGHPSLSPDEYAAQKKQEAQEAAAVFGAECRFLLYGDGELFVTEAIKWEIADIIREVRPEIVITHWRESIHKDHANTHALLPDARFYAAIPAFQREFPAHWVPKVYFTDNWEDHDQFEPELICEINPEDLTVWEEACRKYALFRGEVAKFPYIEYYKALYQVRGLENSYGNTPFAVAFALPKGSNRRRVQEL
jgi:LmbE family N-acetylglucosaminyl deacetylase